MAKTSVSKALTGRKKLASGMSKTEDIIAGGNLISDIIEERKELERDLKRKQKAMSIGRLALRAGAFVATSGMSEMTPTGFALTQAGAGAIGSLLGGAIDPGIGGGDFHSSDRDAAKKATGFESIAFNAISDFTTGLVINDLIGGEGLMGLFGKTDNTEILRNAGSFANPVTKSVRF